MKYYVYILYAPRFDKFYIGQTQNLENRVKRHNAGYEKYTAPYLPWELLWYTTKPNRTDALKLEGKLKNLSKDRVKAFIAKYSE